MHVQTTTHLMIAGSRYATREMLDYARRAVQRAHQLGWTILVGDNPKGVDMEVVLECRRLKAKVIVAGIANFPRNYGCKHGSYIKVTRDLYRSAGGDLLRGNPGDWLLQYAPGDYGVVEQGRFAQVYRPLDPNGPPLA